MYTEVLSVLSDEKLSARQKLLLENGLLNDTDTDCNVLIFDGGELVACASRKDNILKCIAVKENRKGEGLTSTLITELRKNAFECGFSHLFLYTKPKNLFMFEDMFFYPVAKTEEVLLMENKKDGIKGFLSQFEKGTESNNGCIVMNCNPFTKGHRYLVEKASEMCKTLYVFILSEDKSFFSFNDRFEMVKRGTQDIKNVCVLPTGPYLISSATFPTYFLKNRDDIENIHCGLDIEIFCNYFVPYFNIKKRFAGSEPFSKATESYNNIMKKSFQQYEIDFLEFERLEKDGCAISASRVRELLQSKNTTELKTLVPDTTFEYLTLKGFIK